MEKFLFTPHPNAPFVRTRVHGKARSEILKCPDRKSSTKLVLDKVVGAGFAFLAILLLSIFNAQKINAAQNYAGASAELQASSPKKEDNRFKILKAFLEKYNSPLAASTYDFVKNSDAYNLDWKLVAAISGVESTFGQFIPYNSFNAWGWGVYGNNVIYFLSWEEGIETVSKGLRENYLNKWKATNIYEIGRIYAESPTWAARVEYFMEKITEFENQNLAYNLPISL